MTTSTRTGVLFLLAFAAALAAEPSDYFGTWKIESARQSPEHPPPGQGPEKTLLGKSIVLTRQRITGPKWFACAAPKYSLGKVPAEGLFQGMFHEMKRRNPSVDPSKLAAALGFVGAEWDSMATGCEHLIDLHFIDAKTGMFAFDSYLYTIRKR